MESQRATTVEAEQREIFGCHFHAVTEEQAIEQIFRWRDQPQRRSHTVITVNVAILMMMRDDPVLARAVERADLVVADGKPLVWTSRWLGAPLPDKVSGVDLMVRLLEEGKARDRMPADIRRARPLKPRANQP